MDVNRLEYFVTLAKLCSMTKAAEVLFTSHQNLSTAFRRLEKEMDCRLFDRTNQDVFLSEKRELDFKMA